MMEYKVKWRKVHGKYWEPEENVSKDMSILNNYNKLHLQQQINEIKLTNNSIIHSIVTNNNIIFPKRFIDIIKIYI